MDFPKPMLNSPANSGAEAANAFYHEVIRRVDASNEARKVVLEWACDPWSSDKGPDYAEIVRQINLCIGEIRPRLTLTQLTEMMQATPMTEIKTLLKKLQAMVRDVH